jgi:hypothetical protein
MTEVSTLGDVLEFPWEVLEYLSWLRQRPSSRTENAAYLFDVPKVRFGVEEGDILLCDPEIGVRARAGQLELTSPRAMQGILLEGLTEADASAVRELLGLFDGQRTLGEIRLRAGAKSPVLGALVSRGFGNLLFAPFALIEREGAVSGIDITRFPGSPYEIDRSYWRNMGSVRRRLVTFGGAPLDDDEHFSTWLRELHVIALMGEDLQSYYQPSSPISSGRAAPGRLMHTPTRTVETGLGTLILSGPRVNAAQLGGAAYHEALYASVDEPEAAGPRDFLDADGLGWGRLVHGQASNDPLAKAWFCPPRPLRAAHFASLRGALRRALEALDAADAGRCLASLAAFHQRFVRLHPFHCGNQCLAMLIANRILGDLLGAGMPHLMLDHLALCLSDAPYARIFARCARTYIDPQPSAAARYLRLAASRSKMFNLTRRLADLRSRQEAEEIIVQHGTEARLLLLSD